MLFSKNVKPITGKGALDELTAKYEGHRLDQRELNLSAPSVSRALKRNLLSVHNGTITHILPLFCTRYRAAFQRPVSWGVHELR